MEEHLASEARPRSPFPFWENFDSHPVTWIDPESDSVSEPESGGWHRFRPQASFGDPFLEPGRLAILLDVYSYPAVVPRHPGTRGGWTAPNIDLHVLFTHIPAGDEWLLAMGRAPASADGLVGFHSDVWNESGLKLASATGQMVWRQTRPSP